MDLVALAVCLAAGIALAAGGRGLAGRLRPAPATVLLTVAALAVALATGFVACVLAFDALARWPPVAALGGWNPARVPGPRVGPVIGLLAGGCAGALLIRSCRAGQVELAALYRSARACRRMPHAGGLVITPDGCPPYAIAGFPGRIVVGGPVLAELSPAHRRALLAHEQAHLTWHHHLFLQLVELAVSANPLLRPVRPAARLSTERWADEHAAAAVGDRRVVAAAIVAVARRSEPSTTTLAAADNNVVVRVHALLAPRPARHRAPALLALLLVLAPVAAGGLTAHTTEAAFEHARVHHRVAPQQHHEPVARAI